MIYFLAAPKLKLVKVGCSDDVERRVKEIRYHCPPAIKLQLLSVFEGDKDTERAYLKLLAPSRVRGEWFRYDKWMVLAALGLAVPDVVNIGHGRFTRWKILATPLEQMGPAEIARINGVREKVEPPKRPPGFYEENFRKNLCGEDA